METEKRYFMCALWEELKNNAGAQLSLFLAHYPYPSFGFAPFVRPHKQGLRAVRVT